MGQAVAITRMFRNTHARSTQGAIMETTLDTVTIHTGSELCAWCDVPAAYSVLIAGMSHTDNACKIHFAEYYPYLNNAQRESALCPNIAQGCHHTIAQNDHGYGVACVEYADAHGIAWRQTDSK